MTVIDDLRADTITEIVKEQVEAEAELTTDGSTSYKKLEQVVKQHDAPTGHFADNHLFLFHDLWPMHKILKYRFSSFPERAKTLVHSFWGRNNQTGILISNKDCTRPKTVFF